MLRVVTKRMSVQKSADAVRTPSVGRGEWRFLGETLLTCEEHEERTAVCARGVVSLEAGEGGQGGRPLKEKTPPTLFGLP